MIPGFRFETKWGKALYLLGAVVVAACFVGLIVVLSLP